MKDGQAIFGFRVRLQQTPWLKILSSPGRKLWFLALSKTIFLNKKKPTFPNSRSQKQAIPCEGLSSINRELCITREITPHTEQAERTPYELSHHGPSLIKSRFTASYFFTLYKVYTYNTYICIQRHILKIQVHAKSACNGELSKTQQMKKLPFQKYPPSLS